MKYKYQYTGSVDVHLPEHEILAKGGDEKVIYESKKPINHPNFVEVKEETKKGK